jgi:hypothetical protein
MAISISGRTVTSPEDFARFSNIISPPPNNLFLAKKRSMKQAIYPFLSYEFTAPPASFTHEGYGVTLNEINRPYSTPIVDVTGGKSLRCSFEFVIVEDGFQVPIDTKILLIQEIANYGIPVDFDNVHPALGTPLWYIDSITFSHTRINIDGNTAAASCNMSLIEFRSRSQKMILLPRFSYGKFKPKGKPGKPNTNNGVPWDDVEALKAYIAALRQTDPVAARWTAYAAAERNKSKTKKAQDAADARVGAR